MGIMEKNLETILYYNRVDIRVGLLQGFGVGVLVLRFASQACLFCMAF